MTRSSGRDDTARLGRALFYVFQTAQLATNPVVRSAVSTLVMAARAMDFAARLQGYKGDQLTAEVVDGFARVAGIGAFELRQTYLPLLQRAGVLEYHLTGERLTRVDEYVGLTAPMLRQALTVLDTMSPTTVERALLHSVEIASWAPLTRRDHLQQMTTRDFTDEQAADAVKLSLALGVNAEVRSAALREQVLYNPNVWASGQEEVAKFLRGLPTGERDALLGMCAQASSRPGLALPQYAGYDPHIVSSASRVGLLQAATVKSTASGRAGAQTYVFSPVLEAVDDTYRTTEALHQRKLFVAHILYGVEKAAAGRGQIVDPVRLVSVLAGRGTVGPATNIATDYHLLEAHGIVDVRPAGGGRAFLDAVKSEVIEGGLAWLEASSNSSRDASPDVGAAAAVLGHLRPPSEFLTPEAERRTVGDVGEAEEIATSAVLRLREARQEAQRVARFDF